MTTLRTLWLTVLLVALLPWGAYLRAASYQVHPVAPEVGSATTLQGSFESPAQHDVVQKAAIKCRKGVLGSACSPDSKAFVSFGSPRFPGLGRQVLLAAKDKLPSGMTEGPALPPPRSV
jgi:hypothetical protein